MNLYVRAEDVKCGRSPSNTKVSTSSDLPDLKGVKLVEYPISQAANPNRRQLTGLGKPLPNKLMWGLPKWYVRAQSSRCVVLVIRQVEKSQSISFTIGNHLQWWWDMYGEQGQEQFCQVIFYSRLQGLAILVAGESCSQHQAGSALEHGGAPAFCVALRTRCLVHIVYAWDIGGLLLTVLRLMLTVWAHNQ